MPAEPLITLTDAPDAAAQAAIDDGLADYNASQAGYRDSRPLAVLVSDPDDGKVVGGILGRTSLGLLFIDLVFLPEALRGSGVGSRMLRLAEEEAIRRGCRSGVLLTITFQAPDFYARYGWEEFGRIASAPGVERIFMRKTLTA